MTPRACTEADRIPQLRAAISARLAAGETLATVERELISPPGWQMNSAPRSYAWSHPKRRAANQGRLPVWTALANALATLVGIYRY